MGANTLYYAKRVTVLCSATDAQAGYPASNVVLESIARPWLALTAGAKSVTINFDVVANLAALILSDCNFASCNVYKSSDGVVFNLVGALTTFADKQTNRRRGYIDVADAAVKAIRIDILAGTPTDGLAWWRIGSAYPYLSSTSLPRMPEMGMRVDALFPKIRTELPNKRVSAARTGNDLLVLTMQYQRRYDQDVHELLRRARTGTIGLALVPTNYDELVLPLQYVEEAAQETFTNFNRTDSEIVLREVV